jgi:acyl transferase domain-containing protein
MAAGDPIEVGAAMSVLQPGKSSSHPTHHLLLSSFKSEGGHAEPAAAIMGLLRLAAQVSQRTVCAGRLAVWQQLCQ